MNDTKEVGVSVPSSSVEISVEESEDEGDRELEIKIPDLLQTAKCVVNRKKREMEEVQELVFINIGKRITLKVEHKRRLMEHKLANKTQLAELKFEHRRLQMKLDRLKTEMAEAQQNILIARLTEST